MRAWYERLLDVRENPDGFLELGDLSLLIDGRDDVSEQNPEPGRMIVNLHVDDARALSARLDSLGVTRAAPPEYRETAGAWFATVFDPDRNYLQIIELTDAYWTLRRGRFGAARNGGTAPQV